MTDDCIDRYLRVFFSPFEFTHFSHSCLSVLFHLNRVSIELIICQSQVPTNNQKINALLFQLPRNLRQLYAHSYQSLVWNKVASRRIRELGVGEDGKAMVGDLYFPDVPAVSSGTFFFLLGVFFQIRIICSYLLLGLRSVDSSSELCIDESLNPSTVAVPVPEPETEATDTVADGTGDGDSELYTPSSPLTPATPSRVTEDGERPQLRQVVLPLPGYEVILPDNESMLPRCRLALKVKLSCNQAYEVLFHLTLPFYSGFLCRLTLSSSVLFDEEITTSGAYASLFAYRLFLLSFITRFQA